MVPKCFNCFIFQLFPGRRQFEKCSSQNGEPLATIEEEGFALHYNGNINEATRDRAGLYLRISFVRMQLVHAVPLVCKSIALRDFAFVSPNTFTNRSAIP